jgi:hypothetical protein
MSLEYLFDADLQHRPGMEPVVGPEGREGELIGSGDGVLQGPGIRGTIRWTLYEQDCAWDPGFLGDPDGTAAQPASGDQVCKMNLAGVIHTDRGAPVQFEAKGFGLRREDLTPNWRLTASLRFATPAEDHLWLNGVLGLWEGEFDERAGSARYRAYARVDAVPLAASRRLDLEAAG